jgi:nitrate reductase molybdenum cofactor assembly chaperone NarJ/NarW
MNLYIQFAQLLDYPDPNLPGRIKDCAAELKAAFPKAAKLLEDFQHSQQELGIARLQEAYTATFDLQPECTLNLGYHLFGEDQRRGMFLAKLKEFYEKAVIDTGNELPDHLCHLLRYAATRPESEESTAIVADCLLPAVSKIAQCTKQKSDPYRPVLEALLLWLQHELEHDPVSSAIPVHEARLSVSSE